MKRSATTLLLAGAAIFALQCTTASATERRARVVDSGPQLSEHPNSRSYRGQGPQVRGYVKRRGGYSYSYGDSVVEHRDLSILRDYQSARTQGGPFDSGFFFDSGINRYMNDSPYR